MGLPAGRCCWEDTGLALPCFPLSCMTLEILGGQPTLLWDTQDPSTPAGPSALLWWPWWEQLLGVRSSGWQTQGSVGPVRGQKAGAQSSADVSGSCHCLADSSLPLKVSGDFQLHCV